MYIYMYTYIHICMYMYTCIYIYKKKKGYLNCSHATANLKPQALRLPEALGGWACWALSEFKGPVCCIPGHRCLPPAAADLGDANQDLGSFV